MPPAKASLITGAHPYKIVPPVSVGWPCTAAADDALLRSARCLDLDREIERTSNQIRALVRQRRDGVAVMGQEGDGAGDGSDEKKIWISHEEQRRLEMCATPRQLPHLLCSLQRFICRYERQLAARVTELTQRAGDTIAQNVELRREIDEACSAGQQLAEGVE